jgi:hypothetical protein
MNHKSLLLSEIATLASEWVKQQQGYIQEVGFGLSSHQVAIATQVGVKHPADIRILEVDKIPAPTDMLLQQVAEKMNFLGPNTLGITLGYGVYLRKGYVTDRLLSHEFRHVHQYEAAGSTEAFISEYLRQMFQYGYLESPYEVDARTHEIGE